IMITWPDNYYHTSGDRPSICDPTQLHRAIVLAAATAYTIAAADEQTALAIASEVSTGASKRLSLKAAEDLSILAQASTEQLVSAYKKAQFDQDALLLNEQATLESVLELAPNSATLQAHISTLQTLLKEKAASNGKEIDAAVKARATMLGTSAPKRVELTNEEKAAAKVFPHATAKVKESGYGVLRNIPKELLTKYQLVNGNTSRMSLAHSDDIAKLTTSGKLSVLDIKKMQDAQFPDADSLADITRFIQMLKEAGLVE
ncbi:MAG: hypothetical protein SPJ02_10720, partial [Parabacteroides sp.]|nr:hypothetical protein [Parabacteroides sp.]